MKKKGFDQLNEKFDILSKEEGVKIKGGDGTATSGQAQVTSISQDFSLNAASWVPQEGVGVNGSWSAHGNYGLSMGQDGVWTAGVSLSFNTPDAYMNPSIGANVRIYVDGDYAGAFSIHNALNDSPGGSIYETGTVPGFCSFAMPTDFMGGDVTFSIEASIFEDTGAGMSGSMFFESDEFSLAIPC